MGLKRCEASRACNRRVLSPSDRKEQECRLCESVTQRQRATKKVDATARTVRTAPRNHAREGEWRLPSAGLRPLGGYTLFGAVHELSPVSLL